MGREAGERQDSPKGSREACARQVLEVVPQAMGLLRREMREVAGQGLSVPQLRVLAFLGRAPGTSLSAVADLDGVADATASAMVERLVRRGLVTRQADPQERRRVKLSLTQEGATLLEGARAHARGRVAERLRCFTVEELAVLADGLLLLRELLDPAKQQENRS